MKEHIGNHEQEYQALKMSLSQQGQLLPIVTHHGKIVDGVLRERACKELKLKPFYIEMKEGYDSKSLWKALNVDRRHLNPGEIALIGAELATQTKGANQWTNNLSQKEIAKGLGCSEDSLGRAKKVLATGNQELIKRVRAGNSLAQIVKEIDLKEQISRVNKLAKSGSMTAKKQMEEWIKSGVKFPLIYADPPWGYNQKSGTFGSNPSIHYSTMNLQDICALPVQKLTTKDAVVFLWVPNYLLQDGLKVLEAWGFKYSANIVWAKNTNNPSPCPILPSHEILLFGRKGAGLSTEEKMKSWYEIKSPRNKDKRVIHSRKPEEFAQEIERIFPQVAGAKLEMFARQKRHGWHTWGNEV